VIAAEGSETVGFRLSSFNLEAFSDLKCMRALDAQWKRHVFNSAQSRYPTRVLGAGQQRCQNKLTNYKSAAT